MRPALFATAAAVLLAAPAFGQTRAAVPVVRYRLAETDTTWVTQTRCTDPFSDGTRACRRLVVHDGDGEDVPQDSARFWIEGRNGRPFARWAAAGTFYQSLGFDLVRLDLNGDGQVEHVVAHHVSEGNGLGVRYWTVYVVDDRQTGTPLTLGTMEHGDDAFVFTPRGWRLLAGAWEDGIDPRRGPGLYFTGRLYRYADGALVPDEAQPVRRRRYLNSFAAERGRTYEAEENGRGLRGVPGQTPWRWLQHRTTQRLRTDPSLPTTARLGEEPVVFLGYGDFDGLTGPAVQRPGNDRPALLDPMLVDAPTRRKLPPDYVRAGGWPSGGVPARMAWFAPPPVPPGWEDTGGEATYVVYLPR